MAVWEQVPEAWSAMFQVLAWVVTVICILGGAFMTLAFGLSFGNDKTYQWIVSEIFTFFTSVLIVYPCYVRTN